MNVITFEMILKIVMILLSAAGGLSCLYIFGGLIFKNKNSLFIKGNAYLILDVGGIGDKLEYYVRKIENDIDSRCIYIKKIILYYHYTNDINDTNDTKTEKDTTEIFEICKILAGAYNNIILFKSDKNINLFLNPDNS